MLGHLNSHDKLIKTIIIDGSIEERRKQGRTNRGKVKCRDIRGS